MGEIADMMLDGTRCQDCGTYLGRTVGRPQRCGPCTPGFLFVACPVCKFKTRDEHEMRQHMRDKHGEG